MALPLMVFNNLLVKIRERIKITFCMWSELEIDIVSVPLTECCIICENNYKFIAFALLLIDSKRSKFLK